MAQEVIRVEGVREFVKALKEADRKLGSEMRKGMNAAAEVIVQDTKPRLPKGPSGRLQKSLKPRSTQREGIVILGGGTARGRTATVPYAGWIEFGGSIPHHGDKHSHAPDVRHLIRRPFEPEGRTLFPSAKRNDAKILRVMEGVVDELGRKAGLT